jgi:hypothetical protein
MESKGERDQHDEPSPIRNSTISKTAAETRKKSTIEGEQGASKTGE